MHNTDRDLVRVEFTENTIDCMYINDNGNWQVEGYRIADNDVTEVGKEFALGYTTERRDSFLPNLGTDNGEKRFDWRLFFRNLAETTRWYCFNPKYSLEWRRRELREVRRLWVTF
jgi:hypothetical protein